MATRARATGGSNSVPGINFTELEPGKPVSVTHTVEKNVAGENTKDISVGDFEDADWVVERQDDDGWEFIDTHPGRPYEPDLRENYGRGKYKIRPMGPDGKPVERFTDYLRVGSPRKATNPETGGPMEWSTTAPLDDVPPSVRWQMQQASEERAEARRSAAESRARAEEYERRQREREFEREERREREARDRSERDESREQRRNEMMLSLASTFGGALTTIGASFFEAKQPRETEVNDRLLSALLGMQQTRSGGNKALREVVEMLAVLKGIQNDPPPAEPKGEDDDFFATISKAAPILAMLRGNAPAQPTVAQPQALGAPMGQQGIDPQQIAAVATEQILTNPDAIREVARKDPKAAARAFITAVRGDPLLEAAVLEAMGEGEEKDGDGDNYDVPLADVSNLG